MNISQPEWWINKCIEDLYFLCRCVLQTLEDPTPGFKDLYYPTHKRVCNFLQDNCVEGQKSLLLLPRNWLKSYLATCGWVSQTMIKNWVQGKRASFLISNATVSNSKEFLARIKYNFQYNDFLRNLLSTINPELARQLEDPENNAERWTLDEIQILGNRIECGSVEGNLVSRHYWCMINDDLVNLENSRTKEQLMKTIEWWRLARSLLLPHGVELNIGTRWNFDDVYGHIIDKFIKPEKDYHIGKPIVELHTDNYNLMQMDCWADAEKETGSTYPILFPEKKLKQLQEEQEDDFYGQYRNDPAAKGTTKYKRDWFRYYDEADIPDIVYTVMLLDVTDKEKMTSDFTGMVIADIGVNKKVYIRKAERQKKTDRNLIDWICKIAPHYNPATIGIESTKYETIVELMELVIPQKLRANDIPSGYKDFVTSLPHICRELKHRGRPKPIRVENMCGYVQDGTILFPREGAEHLIEELLRFGSWTTDDTADAFGYLQDVLVFPQKTDPVKTFVVPERLKKSPMQIEQEEWEQFKRDCYADGGSPPDVDDIW